jgi:hypothetical protein
MSHPGPRTRPFRLAPFMFVAVAYCGLPPRAAAQSAGAQPAASPPVVSTPAEATELAAVQLRQTEAAARAQAKQLEEDGKQAAKAAAGSAIERARVETDIFSFGIFPNTAGFMDARAHARVLYRQRLSSGLYLDYTTARAVAEVPTQSRAERLVREYRAELDAIKGVFLLTRSGGVAWSLEPGLNGKLIYQDIQDSGYNTNSFEETIFRISELNIAQWVTSAKLDSTVVLGESFTLDLSSEFLPFIYQRESGASLTSQFADDVRFVVTNRTQGFQVALDLSLATARAGRYVLRGKAYRNQGDVASQSSLVSGNFEYTFQTFQSASREDYWLEFVHTANYIPWFGVLVPAFALAYQQKRITTADDSLKADTYKVGFLLEWL